MKKIHMRASMDKGKNVSWRTFCGMVGKFFHVTEDPKNVTCKKCLNKMINHPTRRGKMKSLKDIQTRFRMELQ